MAVPKGKETRLGRSVTKVMEHPLLYLFDADPSFHFDSQDKSQIYSGSLKGIRGS